MGALDLESRKRPREGEGSMTASALKRSAPSSSYHSEPDVREVTFEEALSYVTLVRETLRLHHRMEIYMQFIEVILQHCRGRIDIYGVVIVLKNLFKEHEELKLGVLKFLPPGYEIVLLGKEG